MAFLLSSLLSPTSYSEFLAHISCNFSTALPHSHSSILLHRVFLLSLSTYIFQIPYWFSFLELHDILQSSWKKYSKLILRGGGRISIENNGDFRGLSAARGVVNPLFYFHLHLACFGRSFPRGKATET